MFKFDIVFVFRHLLYKRYHRLALAVIHFGVRAGV
jgi:hypothetical protein